jgi:hypothetical protein
VPCEQKLPLDIPKKIAGIVLGHDAQTQIVLPFWLSFLKNDIIRRAVRMAHQHADKGETIDDRVLYVSSRTIAKAGDSLKASALLNHRFEVTTADLPAVRFAITTVTGDGHGQSSAERLFFQALHDALHYYSEDDFHAIEEMAHIDEVFRAHKRGDLFQFKVLPAGIRNRLLMLLRQHSWEDLTAETCIEALTRIKSIKPEIEELRQEIMRGIKSHA